MTLVRLRYLLWPREVTDRADMSVLSVYREYGVVPKDSRSDNFNKTPVDLSRYQEVRRGDLVVNKMKAWQGSVGVSDYQGIVSPDYLVCSVDPAVESRYLHYMLRSAFMAAQFGGRSKGIRPGQWRLYWDDMADIDVLLPSIAEQRRLSSFLDAEVGRIDSVLALRQQQLSLIRSRTFALIRDVLASGLPGTETGGSGVHWLPKCPIHWEWLRLGWVARCLDGRRVPLSALERAERQGPYPYFGASGVVDHIDDYLFDEELVLIGEDGAQLGNIEYEIAFTVRGRVWVNNHAHVLRAVAIDPVLLAAILNVVDREPYTTGATREKITQEALTSMLLPVPPTTEQQSIVREIVIRRAEQDRLCSAVKTQIARLQERKKSLITAAVTGQIDVSTARGVTA